jgi:hypothetical protein
MKTILIVFEKRDCRRYYISHLMPRWEKMGFRVLKHFGSRDLPDADIAISHIDKTIVPQEYYEALASYPATINRGAVDISRHYYSQVRLEKDSAYVGPVIVKTMANHGGIADIRHKRFRLLNGSWRYKSYLDPKHYPIFDTPAEVPSGAWRNPNLIVEKFCPEKEGDLNFVRYWSFFGDRSDTGRIGSLKPIVKFANAATVVSGVQIPDALKAKRAEMKIDFGRIDFVVHNDEPIILDVNKTLGSGPTMEDFGDQLDHLAEGIKSFVTP